MARLIFLGTGSSLGIPVIACKCEVCTSTSPLNKRMRSSLLLKIKEKSLLLDASPDFRDQALKFRIDRLDGAIFTHAHYDHSAGIDDLRIFHFQNKSPLLCLCSKETAEDLKIRYYYMFKEQPKELKEASRLKLEILPKNEGETDFLGCKVSYFSYIQLGMKVNGFRFGKMAYVTDLKEYSNAIFDHLRNLDLLILSALRFTPSHMHLTIDEAVDFAKKVQAKKTYLTHIAHEVEHEKVNNYLPEDIQLAYDGLQIDFLEG